MTGQEELPLDGRPAYAHDTIGARWWRFHNDHPEVLGALVRLCHEYRERGGTRLGAKMLVERLRWETALGAVPGVDGETFRFDNRYTSRYARYIMDTVPALRGLFELRALHPTETDRHEEPLAHA
jgi:hypothetical protein